MLGSAEEAQDAVQDAYLRFGATEPGAVEHVGARLPAPVLTADGALGPLESAGSRAPRPSCR
ncbi:hypothetical protein [Streptomyces citrinus]|uniref:hypothetical protein n=1 Tax=Streptomyces citrinus TaxID=3118173 RepID=UPI003CC58D6F